MKFLPALRTLQTRVRIPLLGWLALLWALGALASVLLIRFASFQGHTLIFLPRAWVWDILWTLWSPVSMFFVSPLAWRYTGDDRDMGSFTRSLLQALPIPILESLIGFWLYSPRGIETPPTVNMASMYILNIAQWVFVGYAIATWEIRKKRKAEALAKAREAQWSLLQSQMSPHALLNALNGLAQLVREDLERGLKGISDLSEIYRQLLEQGDAQTLPLGRERELLDRFLGVERLRLGQRLVVEWDWDERLDTLHLPPLLLQPLVENAVKHGIAPSERGGILRISAHRNGSKLRLGVANTGRPLDLSLSTDPGLGLRNLEARLSLAFGDKAHFNLKTDGDWTLAEILITGSRA